MLSFFYSWQCSFFFFCMMKHYGNMQFAAEGKTRNAQDKVESAKLGHTDAHDKRRRKKKLCDSDVTLCLCRVLGRGHMANQATCHWRPPGVGVRGGGLYRVPLTWHMWNRRSGLLCTRPLSQDKDYVSMCSYTGARHILPSARPLAHDKDYVCCMPTWPHMAKRRCVVC